MSINLEELRTLLSNVPEAHRRNVEKLVTGEVAKQVICGSCGRIVAEVYSDGKIEPVLDAKGKMWLLAYRYRLDNFLGFQCLCGNDSRLSEQEKGNKGIERNKATTKDVQTIMDKVKVHPSNYPESGKDQKIDNFILRIL